MIHKIEVRALTGTRQNGNFLYFTGGWKSRRQSKCVDSDRGKTVVSMNYDDSPYPIRGDLVASHQRAWERLARAGTWLTGDERVKVMAETRHARDCSTCAELKAALSPYAVTNAHDAATDLPRGWIDMIHLIVADPGRLTHGWYKKTIAGGIAETHFVEILSVLVHTTAMDTFARCIDMPLRVLPEPQPGAPTQYRPKEARQHDAWAPHVSWGEFGANEADFFVGTQVNIRTALTLVPDEARGFFDLVEAQYLSDEQMRDFSQEFRAISHPQIELLAARVSALNQCTY